jgi:hypothetical protein
MTSLDQAFKDQFFHLLQKPSVFTQREVFALWAIIATIVDTRSFSLSEVSRRFGRRVGRNFLGNVLKKYAYVQRTLVKLAVQTICAELPRAVKIYLITDDMIVRKRGKKILGVISWYDHTLGRAVRAWCLVNVALVVDNQVLFVLPWLLTRSPQSGKNTRTKSAEQDSKTQAAIAMFDQLIQWLNERGVSSKRIVVLADSWFSARTMVGWVRNARVIFRIAGKKSYNVQMPDHDAIDAAKQQIQGRPRTIFIKYLRLEEYLGSAKDWSHFTCPETGKKVYYNRALVTLRTTGRVRVYAFRREGTKEPRFILTNPLIKRPPTPKNVYLAYRVRWRIEEVHKDLKQHFGIGKCQCHEAWRVSGFIGLIYFAYSVVQYEACITQTPTEKTWTCSRWATEFHKTQIIEQNNAMAS